MKLIINYDHNNYNIIITLLYGAYTKFIEALSSSSMGLFCSDSVVRGLQKLNNAEG